MTEGAVFRDAGPGDAGRVAALHAASWRSSYRGIMADGFLDGPVEGDRARLWRARLAVPGSGPVTVLCERGGALVGFGCLFVDADPRWGSLVDNLHAAPGHRGLGVGRGLMREMALRAAPGRPVHLFCLEGNRPARGFYERIGGAPAERLALHEPDGSVHPSIRYAWPAPEALLRGCG